MFLREQPTETLKELRDKLDVKTETHLVPMESFKLHLMDRRDAPTIQWGEGKLKVEVPATIQGVTAVGNIVGVPSPFLRNADAETRQVLLDLLIRKNPGEVLVRFTDGELIEVNQPGTLIIDPRRLVDAAMHAIDPLANVVDHWYAPGERFQADVIVPEDFDRGVGGDKPRKGSKKVGDITRGGIRFGVDHKHHLTPWVSQYLYRLACTNGMERCDASQWKIDGRGQTVEDVLREFEAVADRAFKTVEQTIGAFYDLRNTPVENPERTILRLAREQKLNDKVTMRLANAAASEDVPDEPTMFDLVNLITNQANNPDIAERPEVRRTFEMVGGAVVGDHAARCGHCLAKLN